jgi:hypothetical protein
MKELVLMNVFINREFFRVEWNGLRCPLGNTDMFRFVELLVKSDGKPVGYAEIGEACMGDDTATSGAIRNLKLRLVRRLRAAGMADVATAIIPDKEHYRLDLSRTSQSTSLT